MKGKDVVNFLLVLFVGSITMMVCGKSVQMLFSGPIGKEYSLQETSFEILMNEKHEGEMLDTSFRFALLLFKIGQTVFLTIFGPFYLVFWSLPKNLILKWIPAIIRFVFKLPQLLMSLLNALRQRIQKLSSDFLYRFFVQGFYHNFIRPIARFWAPLWNLFVTVMRYVIRIPIILGEYLLSITSYIFHGAVIFIRTILDLLQSFSTWMYNVSIWLFQQIVNIEKICAPIITKAIQESVRLIINGISPIFRLVWRILSESFTFVYSALSRSIATMYNFLQNLIKSWIIPTGRFFIAWICEGLYQYFSVLQSALSWYIRVLQSLLDFINITVKRIINGIYIPIMEATASVLSKIAKLSVRCFKAIISNCWELCKSIFNTLSGAVLSTIKTIQLLRRKILQLLNILSHIKSLSRFLWESIVLRVVDIIIIPFRIVISTAFNIITTIISTLWNYITNFIRSLLHMITGAISSAAKFCYRIVSAFYLGMSDFFMMILRTSLNVIGNLWDGFVWTVRFNGRTLRHVVFWISRFLWRVLLFIGECVYHAGSRYFIALKAILVFMIDVWKNYAVYCRIIISGFYKGAQMYISNLHQLANYLGRHGYHCLEMFITVGWEFAGFVYSDVLCGVVLPAMDKFVRMLRAQKEFVMEHLGRICNGAMRYIRIVASVVGDFIGVVIAQVWFVLKIIGKIAWQGVRGAVVLVGDVLGRYVAMVYNVLWQMLGIVGEIASTVFWSVKKQGDAIKVVIQNLIIDLAGMIWHMVNLFYDGFFSLLDTLAAILVQMINQISTMIASMMNNLMRLAARIIG